MGKSFKDYEHETPQSRGCSLAESPAT
jgi:hypothetical protein